MTEPPLSSAECAALLQGWRAGEISRTDWIFYLCENPELVGPFQTMSTPNS